MHYRTQSPTRQARQAVNVSNFVERIQAEHQACCTAAGKALEHAMRCGDLLIQAKAEIPHGGFQSWLGEHFPGSKRTARAYMRLANHREQLEAKRQSTAILSIGDALEVIAEESRKDECPCPSDSTYHDPTFPELDGAKSYYAVGDNWTGVQLWASSKYPGHYYVTSVQWSADENEGGISSSTFRPVKLNHAYLAWFLRDGGIHDHNFDWQPIDEQILSVAEWEPTWPERHRIERTIEEKLSRKTTRQAADALREIRDRELWRGCFRSFDEYLKARFKLDADGVRAVHMAMDVTGGAA